MLCAREDLAQGIRPQRWICWREPGQERTQRPSRPRPCSSDVRRPSDLRWGRFLYFNAEAVKSAFLSDADFIQISSIPPFTREPRATPSCRRTPLQPRAFVRSHRKYARSTSLIVTTANPKARGSNPLGRASYPRPRRHLACGAFAHGLWIVAGFGARPDRGYSQR